ncbi:MAG: hypothetical protein U1E61_19470 [Bradyrhizobium sp.]
MANVLTTGAWLFAPTGKTPFLSRLISTLIESRQRHADRVVAQYIAVHGNKFTDDAERNIERLLFGEGGFR